MYCFYSVFIFSTFPCLHHSEVINEHMVYSPCYPRLKPCNTEKVLQDYGNRARKLEGQKLDLDDFAQFLHVPVSEMLRDMFALFDEVKTGSITTIIALVVLHGHEQITCNL